MQCFKCGKNKLPMIRTADLIMSHWADVCSDHKILYTEKKDFRYWNRQKEYKDYDIVIVRNPETKKS